MTTESLATIIARIIAVHASQGTPLDSFIDSRADDLTDLCADLGITLAQAQAAQAALLATPATLTRPFDASETQMSRAQAQGHMNRKGHALTGDWISVNGGAWYTLVRTCCPE